jgi:MFS family permease
MAFDWLSADGRRVLLARTLRTFAYGFLAVVLGVYLDRIGLGGAEIGLLLGSALFGSAVLTVLFALAADRFGRRRSLQVCAALMALAGLTYAFSDSFWALLAAALTGTVSATSGEVGPFLALEQAVLPQTAPPERRTRVFALYNLLGSWAGALGSLASGVVGLLAASLGGELAAYRLLFLLYAALAVANLVVFAGLSPKVERGPAGSPDDPRVVWGAPAPAVARFLGVHRSRGVVFRLAALFGLDALAGGFVVQSLIAYWFSLRFGLGLAELGPVFFGANALAALSFLAADRVAARIGLLNTMVFTHLPSNVLLMLVPLMPTAELAVLMLLARSALSQMDVPTRQSYTMAVVDPDERTAAAGFTHVTRVLAQALTPALAGYALGVAALGLPFLAGGALKIVYDLTLWRTCRTIRPPEER